jgi:hypothetical protein
MGTKKYRTLSMPTTNARTPAPKQAVSDQFKISKTEVYEALYGLNAGIQQFLNSLDFLDRAGLGLPFLNGYPEEPKPRAGASFHLRSPRRHIVAGIG